LVVVTRYAVENHQADANKGSEGHATSTPNISQAVNDAASTSTKQRCQNPEST